MLIEPCGFQSWHPCLDPPSRHFHSRFPSHVWFTRGKKPGKTELFEHHPGQNGWRSLPQCLGQPWSAQNGLPLLSFIGEIMEAIEKNCRTTYGYSAWSGGFSGFSRRWPWVNPEKNGGIHQLELFILNVENMVPGKSLLLKSPRCEVPVASNVRLRWLHLVSYCKA